MIRQLNSNPELDGQYDAWHRQRTEFNKRIFRREPGAVKEAWQRFYFKGEFPDEVADTATAPADHVNKRRLKAPRLK